MRLVAWLCGIVVLGQLSGCASLVTSNGNATGQIDRLLEQQEYGKALAVARDARESSSPATANLQETEQRINAHIATYEQQVIARAEDAAVVGEWGAAFDLYRDALSRVPDSVPLRQGEQQLVERHAKYAAMLDLDRLIAKGEWTLKDLELSRLAEAKNPSGWLGPYSLKRKIGHANEIARELAEHGKRALEQNDLALAKRVLPLALSLSSTSETEALNAQLQGKLKEEEVRLLSEQKENAEAQAAAKKTREERQEKKPHAATNGQEQKNTVQLMADFKKACAERNFVAAQRLMSKLEKQGVDDQEFTQLSKEVSDDIERHVQHLIKIGVVHYSRQQYDEALRVWKRAHVLDPKNEQLTARIKRATRVIDNLQNLRTKSGTSQ
jgi:tetratricopeptide (TPR) repeat protein